MRSRIPLLVLLALVLGALAAPPTLARTRRATKAKKVRKPEPAPAPAPIAAPEPGPDAGVPAPDAAAVEPAVAEPPSVPPPPPASSAALRSAASPGAAPAAAPSLAPPGLSAAPGAATPHKLEMRAPHQGGFVANLDCSACHSEDSWRLAGVAGTSRFDHDRTGFFLRGAHVQAQCGGCHTGKASPATACEGCHRDPHQGRHDGACGECHTAVAWADTRTLEQHRRTRMPLTGRHAVLDCSACHPQQGARQFAGTPVDCYSCHRDLYNHSVTHPVHNGSTGQAPFSRDCGLCHQTTAWDPAFADPGGLVGAALAFEVVARHDVTFVISSRSHGGAECSTCHVDVRRRRLVRCDGCHVDPVLRNQHKRPVARAARACLSCHPRGLARGTARGVAR
jgi:hypothetical protein